jgi:enoyl-CoA hydratase/carnithine racemase
VIRVAREGDIVVLSLDRPDQRNALTPEMFAKLHLILDALAGDRPPRALVLTGEGKVFCGGFDLKLCLAVPGTLARLLGDLHRTIVRLNALDIPVVIGAHGAAIAGGCALLAAADTVITNTDARLGYPVTPLGISPAVSAPTLAGSIGHGAARGRLLDPSLLSGVEALRLGLVHECVAGAGDVLPRAVTLAKDLAAKPPHTFASTKRWLCEISPLDPTAGAALHASLSLAGSAEERERLARLLSP